MRIFYEEIMDESSKFSTLWQLHAKIGINTDIKTRRITTDDIAKYIDRFSKLLGHFRLKLSSHWIY